MNTKNVFILPTLILVQSEAKRFPTADALFLTDFFYFICGANSKNKHL